MSRLRDGHKHPVVQYSKEGVLIKIWPSCTDAAKFFNTSQGNISNCARGERKTAQGFKWSYLKESVDSNEVFKKHPFMNIKCSNQGRIWFGNNLISKGQSMREGYYRIKLFHNNERKMFSVHRLVAETFYPHEKIVCDQLCDGRSQIDHIDKNPSNNNIDNLEWVTPSENILRRYK